MSTTGQILVRDGSCKLAADVWLPPAEPHGDGPWPVVLCRSQHGTERYLSWMLRFTHDLGVPTPARFSVPLSFSVFHTDLHTVAYR